MVDLVNDYPCVAGWFCGHDHQGGYVESNGVHYVNFKGMIEASSNAYAIVELSADRLRIKGFANEPSRNLVLRTKK
jgi:hypothetical protein